MKTWKKVFLGFILLCVASLTTCIAIDLSSGSNFIIPADTVEYHTKEDLSDLYWQNKDLLNSVKDSVLSNKAFLQVLVDQKDGDAGILTDENKDLFSEDEWADIVSVFEKLHPYMIMMERKGRPMKFYISFDDLKLDKGSKETSLYWFPSEEELKYHKEYSLADSVEYTKIDEGWYIVEETYPWQ
jgi:hypothetical protein